MATNPKIEQQLAEFRDAIVQSGWFDADFLEGADDAGTRQWARVSRIEDALTAAGKAQEELHRISVFLHDHVVMKILEMERLIEDPTLFDKLAEFLAKILTSSADFKRERGFVKVYGELLSVYILMLYRMGSPGRESTLMRMILTNRARRKAIEMGQARLDEYANRLDNTITVAIITKRYAAYLLGVQGLKVLFRGEFPFSTFGKASENLALQITGILLKHGVRLADVTDIVCAGGDLGTLPDGIYVLNEQVKDESLKRLRNSSLNRGALLAWELREILKRQGDQERIHMSLCSPLSFSTLDPGNLGSFWRTETQELSQSLKGFVKVTPLKSIAAIISEIEKISPNNLNLLIMTLDELFASVVRKTGPHVIREMAAQDANSTLSKFNFARIVDALNREGFTVPPHFGLASGDVGTGVKEICELIMIVRSGKLSPALGSGLMEVVDAYARRAAMIIEMASAGTRDERPHFVVLTSMMALDPYFQELFVKVRNRIDNPLTPIMCLDSLEHEYLIAGHLFELYVNPAPGEKRLLFSVEARSMKQALQVLGSTGTDGRTFSFASLLDEVTGAIRSGQIKPGNVVLVGADNEDALDAVANAREYGLIGRLTLIGDPEEIRTALNRTKIPISPDTDPGVVILPTDPLAVDFESKKKSMAELFREFLKDNPDFLVMKGSLNTADLLREALSVYKSAAPHTNGKSPGNHKLASHTALFVLPDGRFFALSDAGVNPGFRDPRDLCQVLENQVEVVRKVVTAETVLKVAILTAVEKQTSAIPVTHLAAQTVELCSELEARYGPLIVEGPLSFDLATVPEVSEEKHYEGRIKGDANCLVATDINTANVIYKMLSKTMGSLGLIVDNGGIITAGPGTVPIVLTSRGDTAATKFNSILLALAYAYRGISSANAKVRQ